MAEENVINIGKVKDLMNLVKNITIAEHDKSIFESISKTYYRENFHSDILAYYFSYDCVKEKLIDWINRCIEEKNVGERVNFALYKGSPKPKREEGRRDITIYSNDEQHAIIIENKSNRADDMPDQIPRYYESLKKKGCDVSAIIYLNKCVLSDPDFCSWTNGKKIINIAKEFGAEISDKEAGEHLSEMHRRLVIATLNGENGFSQNVIDSVLLDCESVRVCGLSLEIKQLFENLVRGEYSMNTEDIETFINEIGSCREDFNDFAKLMETLENLPTILKNYYFTKLSKQKDKFYSIRDSNIPKFYMNFDRSDGTQFYLDTYFKSVLENELTFVGSVREERNGTPIDADEYKVLLRELARSLNGLGFTYEEDNYVCRYDYIPDNSVLDSEEVLKEFENIIQKYKNLISNDSAK